MSQSKAASAPTQSHQSAATPQRTTGQAGNPSINLENLSAAQVTEVILRAFDEHPEDIVAQLRIAAETLGWLDEIFTTIKNEALDPRNGFRIQRLAEAGAYLAFDFGNIADHRQEKYIERLRAKGVIGSNGGTQ